MILMKLKKHIAQARTVILKKLTVQNKATAAYTPNRVLSTNLGVVLVALSAILTSSPLLAKKMFCVFDPAGESGMFFQKMMDYQIAAIEWGVEFKLEAYPDERVAEEVFKSKQCDAVGVTGIRARQYNSFTGTIDSIGAIPTYDHMTTLLKTLARKNAASLMRSGDYEIVGIVPAGQVFLFVNDRQIDSVGEMSGKKLGVLSADPAQKFLSTSIGASPVDANIATMYSKFNNRSLDIVSGPAIIYDSMELEKGLAPIGGILDYAVGQLTLQILVRHDEFPGAFGQKSRDYIAKKLAADIELLENAENAIDKKWWVAIPKENNAEYTELLRQARLSLRDQGIYDKKMLKVLRKVRCKKDPSISECTAADKE